MQETNFKSAWVKWKELIPRCKNCMFPTDMRLMKETEIIGDWEVWVCDHCGFKREFQPTLYDLPPEKRPWTQRKRFERSTQ